ncbi:hypothetical protein Tco_0777111 [Tanacetum coccineum]
MKGEQMVIQNRRDLPKDIPLDSVEVFRYDEKRSKSENKGKVPTEMELILEQTQQEHQSDTQVITVKMEILLEPTSNKLLVDSILQAGNPVKDILLKLNVPDHRSILTDSKILKDGGEGTDKTKITRKPSKTGKHGYENGRVCKSRKPKSEKSTLS